MKSLRNLVYELDDRMSQVGAHVTTIGHITTMLMHAKEDMDEAVLKESEILFCLDHHKTLHVLSELMFFLRDDLKKNYDDLHKLRGEIFQQVVNGEQKNTSTITSSEGEQIN